MLTICVILLSTCYVVACATYETILPQQRATRSPKARTPATMLPLFCFEAAT